MISHVVLHYNRPWLLRTHIELIKKYCPSVSQIIIADDGSDAEVLNYISNIGADIVYVQPDHKFEWNRKEFEEWCVVLLDKYVDYEIIRIDGLGKQNKRINI